MIEATGLTRRADVRAMSPRRDAIEYGVLVTLASGMAAAYGILIAYTSRREPDGERRRLPRVDLDEPVDLAAAWEDLKAEVGAMLRPARPGPAPPAGPGDPAGPGTRDGRPAAGPGGGGGG